MKMVKKTRKPTTRKSTPFSDLSAWVDPKLLNGAKAAVELGSKTFVKDETLVAGTISIKPNTVIRVKNAATLIIKCTTLIFNGPVHFEGRGENGQNSLTPAERLPEWTSGQHHNDQDRKHREWFDFMVAQDWHPDYIGYDAGPATNGTDGARVLISYRILGDGSGFGSVTYDVAGGKGGAPSRGGLGRVLYCGKSGAHFGYEERHWFRGREGRASLGGVDGRPGEFKLERV